ncbi:hypothetical protein [Streptomyces parvus]|uniref:hypothetical protein n=1 Tax=Streptomyces parvus TaxID=66428 RepID=UPI003D702EAB
MLVKEAGEEAAGCIMSTLTEPAVQAIENVAADLAVQAAANAVGPRNGIDTGQLFAVGVTGGRPRCPAVSAPWSEALRDHERHVGGRLAPPS